VTTVLVDGRSLGKGGGSMRGFGRYLRGLLPELSAIEGMDVRVLTSGDAPLPEGATRVRARRWAPGRFAAREHDLRLPGDIDRANVDVFHSPALEPPARCRPPWVQTLHDVIPLVDRSGAFQPELRRWQVRGSRIREAAAVIAVSSRTADDGIRALDLDPRRVQVVAQGIDPMFTPGEPSNPGPPYLLYVGEYAPNKGYPEAFAVLDAIAAAGLPHTLRVAGRLAPWVRPDVEALVAASSNPGRIELLGYVPDDELVRQYRSAAAVIVTSRYEGFGFPAVEAMASGAPVVAFDNSSLTEVVGDGGLLAVDGDVADFTARLRSILEDDGRREELRDAGMIRARAFSWKRSAAGHAEVFEAVGGAA
jgi:glycosyltransferase involved in cell wall biosynthesis